MMKNGQKKCHSKVSLYPRGVSDYSVKQPGAVWITQWTQCHLVTLSDTLKTRSVTHPNPYPPAHLPLTVTLSDTFYLPIAYEEKKKRTVITQSSYNLIKSVTAKSEPKQACHV